jgi:3-deoxy-D-manno-octulosonate 8-phosphate phosphatase (KDO 8-P phosphatase)
MSPMGRPEGECRSAQHEGTPVNPMSRPEREAGPRDSGDGGTIPEALAERAARIRLLTLDVDGVLTDGRIYVDDHGREHKAFSALDGVGMKMAMQAGITVAWITGSSAAVVAHRARQLGIHHVVLGVERKLPVWERLREELGVPPHACAHFGDDLPDVPLFDHCGLAITVAHAPPAVAARAHLVTRAGGGHGAVREACELILAAQGKLAAAQAAFGA